MESAGRRELCAVLALLAISIVGCDAPRASAPAEVWSAREIRRTPLSPGIAEEEIVDIEWATDSTLFVAIDGGKQLVLLGWDGTVRRRVSRQGNGPGETQFVGWLARIPSGDSLVVSVDLRQFRVAWWTPEGDLVRERPFDAGLATGLWATDAGLVLKTSSAGSGEMRYDLLDDSARVVTRAVFQDRPRMAEVSCGYCPSAVSRDGIIAMATSDTSYRILRARLDGDTLPAIERGELPAVALSRAEADSIAAIYESFAKRLEARGSSEQVVQRMRDFGGQSKYKKRFLGRALVFDEAGWLWVQRTVADGDSAAVDVFGRDAGLRGTVRLPGGMQMRRVRSGTVLATTVIETGETVVLEVEVAWTRPHETR